MNKLHLTIPILIYKINKYFNNKILLIILVLNKKKKIIKMNKFKNKKIRN